MPLKFVITGVGTVNKGAELMLYAILQQIEEKFPDAIVYIENNAVNQGLSYLRTKLDLRFKPYAAFKRFLYKHHVEGILSRLHLPDTILQDYLIDDADYLIDGSGLRFCDQLSTGRYEADRWVRLLKHYANRGTKIILLPQGFGPFTNPYSIRKIDAVLKYSTLIFAREKQSYQYLKDYGADMTKVKLFPDFTSLVSGSNNKRYSHLNGAVCFIPNIQMIDQGVYSKEEYVDVMTYMINYVRSKGFNTYLLNHQGKPDESVAQLIQAKAGDIEFVTGINALEVKGLISTSYVCVTSRFHGAASSLNSCVPCLATSWSHKYEDLFNDYGLTDCVLKPNSTEDNCNKIDYFLSDEGNNSIRRKLEPTVQEIKALSKEMWSEVWKV